MRSVLWTPGPYTKIKWKIKQQQNEMFVRFMFGAFCVSERACCTIPFCTFYMLYSCKQTVEIMCVLLLRAVYMWFCCRCVPVLQWTVCNVCWTEKGIWAKRKMMEGIGLMQVSFCLSFVLVLLGVGMRYILRYTA